MKNIYNIVPEKVFKKLNLHYKSVGDNLQCKCPNPMHPDSGKDGGSLYLHKKDLVFNCFGCEWQGSIFSFIMLINNIGFDDAIEWLKGDGNFNFNSKEFLKTEIGKRAKAQVEEETSIERNPFHLPKMEDIVSKRILSFFEKRHISTDIAFKYGAKVCLDGWYKNRIILPILQNGNLYGFEARIINKELIDIDNKKCLYPANAYLKNTIFDFQKLDHNIPLYFTEGMMDCLSLKSRGYLNSSCSFGSKITSKQIKLLNQFKTINLIPDNDDGGEEFIGKFYKTIKMPEVFVIIPPRDVDECDNIELKQAILKKKNISDWVVDKYLHIDEPHSKQDLFSSSRLKK